MKINAIDVFGVSIHCNDLADIVWQGVSLMEKEVQESDICDARKEFLKYRIEQGKAVNAALLENCVTNG